MLPWYSAIAQDSSAKPISLKVVLQQLNDSIGLQYSGKEELLTSCMIDQAAIDVIAADDLDSLIAPCGLATKSVNEVVVIVRRTALNLFDGIVRDSLSGKAIPNAAILFDEGGTVTDEEGYFVITSSNPNLNINVSHVGYSDRYLMLSPSKEERIFLNVRNIELQEVRIGASAVAETDSISGEDQMLLKERMINAGFYRNLVDVVEDSTFQTVRVPIKPVFRNHGVVYHRVRLPKETRKKIGKVFGFSDGTFVYINPRSPKPRRLTDFYKTESIGPYLYFKEEIRINPRGSEVTWLAERLIEIETGKTFTLTRNRLREIISEDTELLELFNAEKGKSGKLKLYLMEFLRRRIQEN